MANFPEAAESDSGYPLTHLLRTMNQHGSAWLQVKKLDLRNAAVYVKWHTPKKRQHRLLLA